VTHINWRSHYAADPALRAAAPTLIADMAVGLTKGRVVQDLQNAIAALGLEADVWASSTRGYMVSLTGLPGSVQVSNLQQAAALVSMLLPVAAPAPAAAPSPLQRIAEWVKGVDLGELRWNAVNALLDAGVPALALMPVERLPLLIGCTEYACKTQWFEAPLWILQEAEREARRYLD
jgi:hypothetical protein